MFGVAAAAKKQPLWVEKTNKSELRNRLTYRVLIYIFEVRLKTFFLKMRNFEVEIQILKKWKIKKRPHLFFWGWRLNFFWAHVITQDICNKFIDSKFSVGWSSRRMYGLVVMLTIPRSTTMSLINMIDLSRFGFTTVFDSEFYSNSIFSST